MDWDVLGGVTGLVMGLRREAEEGDVTVTVSGCGTGGMAVFFPRREKVSEDR